MDDVAGSAYRQPVIYSGSKRSNALIQQFRQKCADDTEGQIKDQAHNSHKAGNGCIFARQNPVNFDAAQMLLTLVRLYHRLIADTLDKIKTHVGNGRRPIQATFGLHLGYDMLQHLFFILIQVQRFQNQPVALCQLGRRKPHRNLRFPGVILDQMHNGVQAAVYRAAVLIGVAVVDFLRPLLIFGHMQGMGHQLVNTLIFRG